MFSLCPPFQGGYPVPGLWVGGYSVPGLDGGGGVPQPGLDGGGGIPARSGWWRGTPARSGWWGVPGVTPPGKVWMVGGTLGTTTMTGWGTPHHDWMG